MIRRSGFNSKDTNLRKETPASLHNYGKRILWSLVQLSLCLWEKKYSLSVSTIQIRPKSKALPVAAWQQNMDCFEIRVERFRFCTYQFKSFISEKPIPSFQLPKGQAKSFIHNIRHLIYLILKPNRLRKAQTNN